MVAQAAVAVAVAVATAVEGARLEAEGPLAVPPPRLFRDVLHQPLGRVVSAKLFAFNLAR